MINIHPLPGFTSDLMPIVPPPHKGWWQDNVKTRNHAQHCLPLAMANSLGYYILSPVTFSVEWNGDIQADAVVKTLTDTNGFITADAHATHGGFTIQPGFIATTDVPGDFIMIKNLPNERFQFFTCMEALIEGWWSKARFGLVCLMTRPGKFLINRGDPVAQLCVYRQEAALHDIVMKDMPPEYTQWEEKRKNTEYKKLFDYFKGLHPDGTPEPTHVQYWPKRK